MSKNAEQPQGLPWKTLITESEIADLEARSRPGAHPISLLDQKLKSVLPQSGAKQRTKQLIRAVAYIWHDHLEEAHKLCQGVPTADGALVHAILHRREPDFSNARYWLDRAGTHPIYGPLAVKVHEWLTATGSHDLLTQLLPHGHWDALAFVSACEQVVNEPGSSPTRQRLKEIQKLEFESLLGHFFQGDAG